MLRGLLRRRLSRDLLSATNERLSRWQSDQGSGDRVLRRVRPPRIYYDDCGKRRIKKREIAENAKRSVTRGKSRAKKGSPPLKVPKIGTSQTILLIMKTFRPTGGVIGPTSTTIRGKIPNQMAVSSTNMPNSRVTISGKNTWMINKIMARLSIRQPSNR